MSRTGLLSLITILVSSLGCPGGGTKHTPGPGDNGMGVQATPERAYAYQEKVLDNGLRVITLVDDSTPIAAVQLWYHVGSKDEKPNRRGFAHMFEHMMFRGTENIGPKAHFEYLRKVGGDGINAYTSFDNTTYIQEVPVSQLEMVFWLEAERMAFLKINQGYFDTERKVVAEEYRRGREQPYGKVIDKALAKLYTVHPYQWSPIGDMGELAEAKSEELQEFWNRYYVPNNATLVVVGDIEHEQVQKLAERYFGWIPRYPDPPRITIKEPVQTEPRKIHLKEDNGPAPVVGLVWHTVPTGHKDEIALGMLAQILGQGESSRLYRDVVTEKKLGMFAIAVAASLEDDGIFGAGAVLSILGSKPQEVLTLLREHIALIKKEGVTDNELLKAKNNALRDAISARLSVSSKAQVLGDAAVLKKNLSRVNSREADIQAVTNEDIKRVAIEHLLPERENEIFIEPSSLLGFLAKQITKKKKKPADADPPSDAGKITGGGSGKPGLERPSWMATTPPIGKPQTTELKLEIEKRTLANGLKVVVVQNHEVPFVTYQLALQYGAYADPANAPGTASIATAMLTRGTAEHSYKQLSDELDLHAISLGGSAGMDSASVSASATKHHWRLGLKLLAEVVRTPTFPKDELESLLQQTKTGLAIAQKAPEYVAEKQLRQRLFAGHPYERDAQGEVKDLDKITSEGLTKWWATYARPDRAVLYIAGDVSVDAAFSLAEKYLGSWKAQGPAPEIVLPPIPKPAKTKIYLVDRRSDQAQIRVGHVGITLQHPDYFKAKILSEVVGGGFSSRLNDRLRVKEGLTYGARGGFRTQRFGGTFVVSTFSKNATVGRTVEVILDEIKKLKSVAPTDREMADAQGYLLGSFAGSRETPQDIVGDLWLLESRGLPSTWWNTYLAAVAKVNSADVLATANKLVDDSHLTIVVVGQAKDLLPQLEKIAEVEVVKGN